MNEQIEWRVGVVYLSEEIGPVATDSPRRGELEAAK